MRILVTTDTIGGVWTYTRELVTGLAVRGVDLVLVSFGSIPDIHQTWWLEGLSSVDYRPTAFKLEWMQDSESDLAASAEYLETVIAETSPDLLHLNQFYYGALENDLPRIVVAHSDVVSWWMAVHQQEPPESRWMRWYTGIVRRGLAAATAVVAPSCWMMDQIVQHYGKPAISSVIYNGRTPSIFNPAASKEKLVVTLGRQWDQAKNAALLLQRPMPAPICIIGSDRHPESQGHAFTATQPDDTVHFEPQQDESQLNRLLAKAAIYAATSCYEPFGLAPLEAAFSRCAIVASDIPSFRELWDGAALFFENNDADSLCQALDQLVRSPKLLRNYANLALYRAQQRFTASRMVENYLPLYKRVGAATAVPV